MITYRWFDGSPADDANPDGIEQHLVKEQHFYISEDNRHDQPFVDYGTRHYLSATFQPPADSIAASPSAALQPSDLDALPEKVIIWNDGCAAQFNSNAFADNAKIARDWQTPVEHHFFCSGHGKGEHDGAGAEVKHKASLQNLKSGQSLTNAEELVAFCNENPKEAAASSYRCLQHRVSQLSRCFHMIDKEAIAHDDKWKVDTVKGSRSMHALYFQAGLAWETIKMSMRSCFCEPCQTGDYEACTNVEWVPTPHTERLVMQQGSARVTRALMRDAGDDFASLLQPGVSGLRHVAVVADREDFPSQDYFIICATKGLHILDEVTTDDDGHEFELGSKVFEGWYFERHPNEANWSPVKRHYYANRCPVSRPRRVLMYTHLVRKMGFELPEVKVPRRKKTVYGVRGEVHEELLGACSV